MRLCFIADPNHVNTRNWVRYFAGPLGHEVHLICLVPAIGQMGNVKMHDLRLPLARHKIRYFLSIPAVKKIIKSINPDILIGYRITSYGFVAAATGFHPLVIAAQGSKVVYKRHSIALYLLARFTLRRADLLNSWAPHMTKDLIELGANPQKIITIPRGVDTSLFSPKNGLPDAKKFRMVSTRSLRKEPVYNIKPIIDALHLILSKNLEVEYWILGDGPRRLHYIEYVSRVGLEDHVKFIGNVEYNMLPKYLQNCQVYVSNVWSDGVSSSLLEAMACGLFPVVVDNVSNRQWIKNGINGFLVPPDSPEALSSAISTAFQDKELRSRAADLNRKKILDHASWEKNMLRIESAYIELIRSIQTD